MLIRDFFGQRLVNPSADLDEDTLRAIAERTGGAYFRARDAEALSQIYQRLDELEPVESDQQSVRPVDDLFYWPLALALTATVLAAAAILIPATSFSPLGRFRKRAGDARRATL
jgi:Ca-activated chloride channel family protein